MPRMMMPIPPHVAYAQAMHAQMANQMLAAQSQNPPISPPPLQQLPIQTQPAQEEAHNTNEVKNENVPQTSETPALEASEGQQNPIATLLQAFSEAK